MSTTQIIALIAAFACLAVILYIVYDNGKATGERIGRDKQRADDIIELWKLMPDRDNRGRFMRKAVWKKVAIGRDDA